MIFTPSSSIAIGVCRPVGVMLVIQTPQIDLDVFAHFDRIVCMSNPSIAANINHFDVAVLCDPARGVEKIGARKYMMARTTATTIRKSADTEYFPSLTRSVLSLDAIAPAC
jgi:hypothetical protein